MAGNSQVTSRPAATATIPPDTPSPSLKYIHFQQDAAEAERLKVLGNELYQRGRYKEALDKYGEAIKKDRISAVIYANRAAVFLAMKEHVDAVFDCEKATSIDPNYAKGWGRLGTALYALSSWDECINAWQKALECLSKPNLTQPETALKTQIERGLKKARQGSAQNAQSRDLAPAPRAPRNPAWIDSAAAPWNIATALREEKMKLFYEKSSSDDPGPPSCVLGLSLADYYFKDSMTRVNALVFGHMGANAPSSWAGGGVPGFFDSMTIAILTDERVFRVGNPQSMYARIFRQYEFENVFSDGLVEGGGVENIKKEVLKRLKEQGWKKLQGTIQLTVRYWIFQAFWRYYLYGPNFLSHKLYTRALEFIEWGRSQWPDVPHSVCGTIFQRELIRGLKRLRIQHMQMLLDTKQHDDVEHLFTMKDLLTAAEELITDIAGHNIDEIPRGTVDVGHLYAFWLSPSLHANRVRGFVYYLMGQAWSATPELKHRAHEAYENASHFYTEAIAFCPEDDQNLALLLRKRLDCMCYGFRPLSERLAVCEAIRKATPLALGIWFPPDRRGVELVNNLAQVEQFDDWCRKEVADGKMGMDEDDRWFIPMPFVYEDVSKVPNPFQPLVFTREREDGELTDRRIWFEPPRPPKHAGPSQKN